MRKHLVLVIGFLMLSPTFTVSAEEIKWHSVAEMLSESQNEKPIYVFIYADWDGFGRMFQTKTLADDQVVAYLNEHFYAVKFNADDTTSYQYKGRSYADHQVKFGRHFNALALELNGNRLAHPSHVFLESNLKLIGIDVGFKEQKEFMKLGRFFARDYKTMTYAEFQLREEIGTAVDAVLKDFPNEYENIKGIQLESMGKLNTSHESKVKIPEPEHNYVSRILQLDTTVKTRFSSRLAFGISTDSAYQLLELWQDRLQHADPKTISGASFVMRQNFIEDKNDRFGQVHYLFIEPSATYANIKMYLTLFPTEIGGELVSVSLYIEKVEKLE